MHNSLEKIHLFNEVVSFQIKTHIFNLKSHYKKLHRAAKKSVLRQVVLNSLENWRDKFFKMASH